jgi:hypothetical protein
MKPDSSQKMPLDHPVFDKFPQFKKLAGERKPRSSDDVCLLCLENPSEKIESHIIPTFLIKSIFKDLAKRRMIRTDGARRKVVSSGPWEYYLLCLKCENRLGALERLVSHVLPKRLEEIRKSPKLCDGGFHIHFDSLHPALMHLFVYSLLWRAEVCQQPQFSRLVVSPDHTETIRSLLNLCLGNSPDLMIRLFQKVYSGIIPIQYQAFTFYQEPRREYRMLFAHGHDYNSPVGYRVYANEIAFAFMAESKLGQNAFTYVKEALAMNAREWEVVTGFEQAIAAELNQLYSA